MIVSDFYRMPAQMALRKAQKQRLAHQELVPFMIAARQEWQIVFGPILKAKDAKAERLTLRSAVQKALAMNNLSESEIAALSRVL